MSRVRLADRCNDRHYARGTPLVCGRAQGHPGDHAAGKVRWPRRIDRPPAGSSTAASPMR